jgi:hypothetical protein
MEGKLQRQNIRLQDMGHKYKVKESARDIGLNSYNQTQRHKIYTMGIGEQEHIEDRNFTTQTRQEEQLEKMYQMRQQSEARDIILEHSAENHAIDMAGKQAMIDYRNASTEKQKMEVRLAWHQIWQGWVTTVFSLFGRGGTALAHGGALDSYPNLKNAVLAGGDLEKMAAFH